MLYIESYRSHGHSRNSPVYFLTFEMDTPLIIGDSRLEGFQLHVDNANPGTVPIYISKNSGKGIQDLTNIAIEKTTDLSHSRIIIAGGICDCTERNTDNSNPREKFIFKFDSVDSMTNYLNSLFIESNKQISKARPNVVVSYSELIGMDMSTVYYTKNPTAQQQDILDQTIMNINPKIVALNEYNSSPTPWISKRVHINRKNGPHHQYERLSDGIHYSDDLKRICAKKYVETIYKML